MKFPLRIMESLFEMAWLDMIVDEDVTIFWM